MIINEKEKINFLKIHYFLQKKKEIKELKKQGIKGFFKYIINYFKI